MSVYAVLGLSSTRETQETREFERVERCSSGRGVEAYQAREAETSRVGQASISRDSGPTRNTQEPKTVERDSAPKAREAETSRVDQSSMSVYGVVGLSSTRETQETREFERVERCSAPKAREAETSRVGQTSISRDSGSKSSPARDVAKVEISPPGAIERAVTNVITTVITAKVTEHTGKDTKGVAGAAAIGQAVREAVVVPVVSAVCSEKTTTYTDGSKSVADFSGSREYDSQGRITGAQDRFGGSVEVSHNASGGQTVTIYEDGGSSRHIIGRSGSDASERAASSGGSDGGSGGNSEGGSSGCVVS